MTSAARISKLIALRLRNRPAAFIKNTHKEAPEGSTSDLLSSRKARQRKEGYVITHHIFSRTLLRTSHTATNKVLYTICLWNTAWRETHCLTTYNALYPRSSGLQLSKATHINRHSNSTQRAQGHLKINSYNSIFNNLHYRKAHTFPLCRKNPFVSSTESGFFVGILHMNVHELNRTFSFLHVFWTHAENVNESNECGFICCAVKWGIIYGW